MTQDNAMAPTTQSEATRELAFVRRNIETLTKIVTTPHTHRTMPMAKLGQESRRLDRFKRRERELTNG